MPFEKRHEEILTGGINLLPPSDLIARDQAEVAINWRVDQQGALRGRQGMEALSGWPTNLGSGTGYVHSLMLVEDLPDKRRYAGADELLYRNGVVVIDSITGAPVLFNAEQLGLCSFEGMLWVMNKARQGRDDGSNFYSWLPAPPEHPATVAKTTGDLGSKVRYYVTFSTAEGYESNPGTYVDGVLSPISDWIEDTAASFGVALSAIPVSTDPQVTQRHIYREGGMLPAPYRVHTLDNNTTKNWTDDGSTVNGRDVPDGSTSDAEAVADGFLMEDDHDPAPPAAVMLQTPYFNRILAGGTDEHPNRLFWTPSNKLWYFPGSDSELEGNWVDIGELNEWIVGISPRPRMCIIYKEHSIWRMIGDMSNGILEQTNSDTGLIGRKAWAQAGPVDYLQGKEGIYQFSGDIPAKSSPQLDPIFKGWHTNSDAIPIDQALREQACMAVKHDRLYFSYPEES
jgi:hypothetical protein